MVYIFSMAKKRLFIGIFVHSSVLKKQYIKIKKELSGVIPGRWVSPESFHITVKFLGEVEEEKILDIQNSLKSVIDKTQDISLHFKGLGVFPNLYNPKILYVKVEDKDGFLYSVNSFVETELEKLGFKKELKPFLPHITIKRIKHEVDQNKFLPKFKRFENVDFGTQKSVEVNIIESFLTPKGAIYKKLTHT